MSIYPLRHFKRFVSEIRIIIFRIYELFFKSQYTKRFLTSFNFDDIGEKGRLILDLFHVNPSKYQFELRSKKV